MLLCLVITVGSREGISICRTDRKFAKMTTSLTAAENKTEPTVMLAAL